MKQNGWKHVASADWSDSSLGTHTLARNGRGHYLATRTRVFLDGKCVERQIRKHGDSIAEWSKVAEIPVNSPRIKRRVESKVLSPREAVVWAIRHTIPGWAGKGMLAALRS